MKKTIMLITSILFFSCGNNDNRSSEISKSKVTPQPELISETRNTLSDTIGYKLLQTYDIYNGDPDTSLALFLYKNHEYFNLSNQREEYQRFAEEYENQIALIKNLFGKTNKTEDVIKTLDSNVDSLIMNSRRLVLDNYEKYNSVEGMTFGFLISIEDSIVKPMIYKVLENPKAPIREERYLTQVLLNKYNDSTYIDSFK